MPYINMQKKHMPRGPGIIQRKIILLLLAGLALGVSRSPARSFRIIRLASQEWRSLKRQALWRSIKRLYQSKLISAKQNSDGTYTILLTQRGREQALTYKIDEMKIPKPPVWDGKWRIITFDIPEKQKKIRDALRLHLRQMGFEEFQKSVLICPYPCDDEVEFVIELFHARPYVRKILAEALDNELHFQAKFQLLET